jgi:hypothetical protein
MKTISISDYLFHSFRLSCDQLEVSEGPDSFTIDAKDIPVAILAADSSAAEEILSEISERKGYVQFVRKFDSVAVKFSKKPKL